MSEAVKDLIQQALDQDFNQANKTFQDVITVKMTDVLDQEKIRLADAIYNGVEPDGIGNEDDFMGDEDGDQLELDLDTEDDDEAEAEEVEGEEDADTDDDDEDLMAEIDTEYELEDEEEEE